MTMSNAQRLVDRIRSGGLKPRPRWMFVVRAALARLAYAGSAALGALAFSVVLFAIQQAEFNLLKHAAHSRLELFLSLLPLVWLGLLALGLALAAGSARRQPGGYKIPFPRRLLYSLGLSAVLGTGLFVAGGAQVLEYSFAEHVDFYNSLQEKKMRMWSQPDRGYLSGELLETGSVQLRLRAFDGLEWAVRYDSVAFIAPIVRLQPGDTLKILGWQRAEQRFSAREIRPWSGLRHHGRHR
jgi:hypothetical protein